MQLFLTICSFGLWKRIRWGSTPNSLAATTIVLAWFEWTPPTVTIQPHPFSFRSAKMNSALRTSSWWVLTSHDTWNNNDYVTLKSRLKNLVSWQDTSCQIISFDWQFKTFRQVWWIPSMNWCWQLSYPLERQTNQPSRPLTITQTETSLQRWPILV